jgi:pimeloyl-ACP methyl ester carboxylesterase
MHPRHAHVRSGPLRLHCLLWGDDAAPSVLLVHGNGGHAHWWDPLVSFFLPEYRLIVPDLRGHGESDWPRQPAYRITDFAADLLAVVDALAPGGIAIIAHSMGARAAAWFAVQEPERVRGLALLDTSIAGVDAATAERWRGRVAGQRAGRGYPSYETARAAFRFVPPEPGVPAAIVAALAHHAIVERGPGDWTFRFDRAVLSLDGDGAGDLTALIAGLPCPLWIGRGTGSVVSVARQFDALRARRPDLALHDFAGAHHFFLSEPETAGRALRAFLDRLPARASA